MMVPLINMMLFIDVDVKNLMKNIRLIRWQIFLYIIKKGERKLMRWAVNLHVGLNI